MKRRPHIESVPCRDGFELDRAPGTVIGSSSSSGCLRLGVDSEEVMAIDNGALRIGFLERPGWGREAIAYGPFESRAGLTLSVLALNGHHASEVHVPPVYGRRARAARWLRERLLPGSRAPDLSENFMVGWSGRDAASGRPTGAAFAIRPAVAENGELCGIFKGELVTVLRSVRNVPLLYVVGLRERGAAYYAASLDGVPGLPSHPRMRPLGIDVAARDEDLLATVHQSVLGESGWRVDSRVHEVRVDELDDLSLWCGTAHAADRLAGVGALHVAEIGGPWQAGGDWVRGPDGAAGQGQALLLCPEPSGLVHVEIAEPVDGCGIVWRSDRAGDGFSVSLERSGIALAVTEGGARTELARDDFELSAGGPTSLQVLDDGREISVIVDGRLAFGGPVSDERLADARWAGLHAGTSSAARFTRFEAHPRSVPVPPALDPGAPWDRRADEEIVVDRFEGPAGELDAPWSRREGRGRIDRTGSGAARVVADRDSPNPGRTVYTLPWVDPGFAELAVDHTPPGTNRGEGENGRCGLVFMQDPRNYLLVNVWVDDEYPGSSVSSFLTLDGEEDHYRAVWCNVGRSIRWGAASRLSIAFDGMRWTARVDGRPVLQRALSDVYPTVPRLRIAEVGIAVNWEWGDDTGTVIHRFSAARSRSSEGST